MAICNVAWMNFKTKTRSGFISNDIPSFTIDLSNELQSRCKIDMPFPPFLQELKPSTCVQQSVWCNFHHIAHTISIFHRTTLGHGHGVCPCARQMNGGERLKHQQAAERRHVGEWWIGEHKGNTHILSAISWLADTVARHCVSRGPGSALGD